MEKVGTRGRYQWILYAITLLTFFCANYHASVSFYFLNPEFDCSNIGGSFSSEECENYVCNLVNEEERKNFPTHKTI